MAAPRASVESAAPILALRGVGRRFGGVHAVRDVDLEVRPRERRAILGPNGAGKTTLFNLISGEFPPSSGAVELFGSAITPAPPPCPEAGEDGPLPHLPDGAPVPRPHGRGQRLPSGPRRTRGAPPAGALAEGRRDARARPRSRHRDGPGRGPRPDRRLSLPWQAAPTRG